MGWLFLWQHKGHLIMKQSHTYDTTKSIISRMEYLLSLPANTEEETDELQALIDLEVEFYEENH